MPPLSHGAFGALTLALLALWLPPAAARWWIFPGVVAVALAVASGLMNLLALLALIVFASAALVARRTPDHRLRTASYLTVLGICGALFLHAVPGFDNPRVLTDVQLSADAARYTKYLNFDKGMAGLILLGLLVPQRSRQDKGGRELAAFPWRFAAVTALVMAVSIALGYVRWNPKLPPWWPLWAWSMLALTALPEEALFRGVIQDAIAQRAGAGRERVAIIGAGLLFGVAHLAGGPLYVLVASIAGVGYGWIYASTRSIAAAIVAHAGLNAVHFFLFTYPALQR